VCQAPDEYYESHEPEQRAPGPWAEPDPGPRPRGGTRPRPPAPPSRGGRGREEGGGGEGGKTLVPSLETPVANLLFIFLKINKKT